MGEGGCVCVCVHVCVRRFTQAYAYGSGHATRSRSGDAMPMRGPRVALAVGLRTLLVLLRPTSLLARTRGGVSLDDITKAHTELMASVGRALAAEMAKDEKYEADPWEQPDW